MVGGGGGKALVASNLKKVNETDGLSSWIEQLDVCVCVFVSISLYFIEDYRLYEGWNRLEIPCPYLTLNK